MTTAGFRSSSPPLTDVNSQGWPSASVMGSPTATRNRFEKQIDLPKLSTPARVAPKLAATSERAVEIIPPAPAADRATRARLLQSRAARTGRLHHARRIGSRALHWPIKKFANAPGFLQEREPGSHSTPPNAPGASSRNDHAGTLRDRRRRACARTGTSAHSSAAFQSR